MDSIQALEILYFGVHDHETLTKCYQLVYEDLKRLKAIDARKPTDELVEF